MNAPETKQSLIDLLKPPVEIKPDPKINQTSNNSFDVFNKQTISPPVNQDDFEPIKELNTPVTEVMEPQPVKSFSKKPRLSEKEYEEQAVMAVEFFDGLNQLALPWAYQRTIFTASERAMLKVIQKKYKQKETILEPSEQKLMEKFLDIQEAIKEIPLADNEKDMILDPLSKVFSKYNIQLSVEFMLLTALTMIYGPRYMPMFNRLEK